MFFSSFSKIWVINYSPIVDIEFKTKTVIGIFCFINRLKLIQIAFKWSFSGCYVTANKNDWKLLKNYNYVFYFCHNDIIITGQDNKQKHIKTTKTLKTCFLIFFCDQMMIPNPPCAVTPTIETNIDFFHSEAFLLLLHPSLIC